METLEEAAERYADKIWDYSNPSEKTLHANCKKAFLEGAKLQAKRIYSYEDLAEAFEAGKKVGEDNACMAENYRREDFKEWFEQFKNK